MSLTKAASNILQAPPDQRDVIEESKSYNNRNYDDEQGMETVCKLLSAMSSNTHVDAIENGPTLWQINWAEVSWPAEDDLLTKLGERLFFKTTVRDLTGPIDVFMNEQAALSLAGVQDKDAFLAAKQEGKQLFPVMASVKVLRQTKAAQSDVSDVEQPADSKYINFVIVQAQDQPLDEAPTQATVNLIPLIRDLHDDTASILPAAFDMVCNSAHYAFTVQCTSQHGVEMTLPCQKIMCVIKSHKDSKAEALGTGFKLITPEVQSLWADKDASAHQATYTLSSICTLDNLPRYRLDPPRGRDQYALVTITAKVGDMFVVEHVQLLDETLAKQATESFQKLLHLAMHLHLRDRKRSVEWSDTCSPAASSKKCRLLGRSPTDGPIRDP